MEERGVLVQKPKQARKRLLQGKQMFVNKVIEKEVFAAGKGERKRISGVWAAWRRVAGAA